MVCLLAFAFNHRPQGKTDDAIVVRLSYGSVDVKRVDEWHFRVSAVYWSFLP